MSHDAKPLLIIPVYNTSPSKARRLLTSLLHQSRIDFNVLVAIDSCAPSADIYEYLIQSLKLPFPVKVHVGKKRLKALGNIVKSLFLQDPSAISWVGIIDGDDYLCEPVAVAEIDQLYKQGAHVVWSKFLWDGRPSDLCKPIPATVNPYEYPWVSSHFKTFRYSLFLEIPISNYLDDANMFLPRCYDHALMLPLLYCCYLNGLETGFVNKYFYYYDNEFSSTPETEHTNGRLENAISLYVRNRGYLSS